MNVQSGSQKVRIHVMFESILCQVTEYDPDVLESLIGLASRLLARVEREGASARYLHSGMRMPCSRDPDR